MILRGLTEYCEDYCRHLDADCAVVAGWYILMLSSTDIVRWLTCPHRADEEGDNDHNVRRLHTLYD
jgi:hypothetical protein